MDNELHMTEHEDSMVLSDFDRFFDILCEGFPKEEHRYYNHQMELLDDSRYRIRLIYWKKEIVGIMAYWLFDDFTYLEHFTVATAYRNCKIGYWALSQFKETYDKIVLEVELPKTVISKRRIMFYNRNGFALHTGFLYTQPPLEEEFKKQQMILMTAGLQPDENQLMKIRDTLYKNVYKQP